MKTSPRIEKAARLEMDILDMLVDYMRNSRIAGLERRVAVVSAVRVLLDSSEARKNAGLKPRPRGLEYDPKKYSPDSPECMEVWRFIIGEIRYGDLEDFLLSSLSKRHKTIDRRTIKNFVIGAAEEIIKKVARDKRDEAEFFRQFGVDVVTGEGW
jgi:translation initiation factor 2B subunit (eIF-2B alpha/beta/delta family)